MGWANCMPCCFVLNFSSHFGVINDLRNNLNAVRYRLWLYINFGLLSIRTGDKGPKVSNWKLIVWATEIRTLEVNPAATLWLHLSTWTKGFPTPIWSHLLSQYRARDLLFPLRYHRKLLWATYPCRKFQKVHLSGVQFSLTDFSIGRTNFTSNQVHWHSQVS